jgi:hypothetical protein
MIAYDFVPLAPSSLDQLQTELIVLPFFGDERPLLGAAGFVDWRLCGALSRRLMAGYLDGHWGEKALIATPPKLKVDGLLLVGLGHSTAFDARIARRVCALIGETLTQARVSTAALALPGRSMDLLTPLEAMQLWLGTSPTSGPLAEITIIEQAGSRRALESLFEGLRRQAESPLD